jgi:hypothetical protein
VRDGNKIPTVNPPPHRVTLAQLGFSIRDCTPIGHLHRYDQQGARERCLWLDALDPGVISQLRVPAALSLGSRKKKQKSLKLWPHQCQGTLLPMPSARRSGGGHTGRGRKPHKMWTRHLKPFQPMTYAALQEMLFLGIPEVLLRSVPDSPNTLSTGPLPPTLWKESWCNS